MHVPRRLRSWLLLVAGLALGGPQLGATDFVEVGAAAAAPATVSGDFLARHVEDRAGIAILELDGSYDRFVAGPSGAVNAEARQVVAREFYAGHPDDYDFLVVFTTFEFDTGASVAFHLGVQNRIEGIGRPLADASASFGSSGRLGGYVDMGALTRHATDPLDPRFERTLGVLAHEVVHQWCCYVDVRLPDGTTSDALRGREGVHWSYLLDSDASLLYGSDWRDNGDGTFTAAAVERFLSPLDLYLAGFYAPEEVPPFVLVQSPGTDRTLLPELGATVAGDPLLLTIEDVTAANGPRTPAADQERDERHDHRAAFILLTRPGEPATEAQVLAVDRIRRQFATRFSVLTGGRGLMHVLPEALPAGEPGEPGLPPTGEGTRPPQSVSLADALAWLRGQALEEPIAGQPALHWRDRPGTRLRDTTIALATLIDLDPAFTRAADALRWLEAQPALSTDALARLAAGLQAAGREAAPLRSALAARQNPDGGWGLDPGHASDPLDTALAIVTLGGRPELPAARLAAATQYLTANRGADGGWSNLPGTPSRVAVTAAVLRALAAAGEGGAAADAAISWLAVRQAANGDGGLGDRTSSVHETAQVVETLVELGALDRLDEVAAEAFLRERQAELGSWDGSVYATAMAVRALKRFQFANWKVSGLAADPQSPRDGQRLRLAFTVANDGNAGSPATVARLFDGDPAAGGSPTGVETTVPALAPGRAVDLSLLWDTFDEAGSHVLFVVVDPDGAVAEVNEQDNAASVAVQVEPAPDEVDLEIVPADITITPPAPNSLPTDLSISAVVRNFGRRDAANVRVRLWRGAAESGVLVEEVVLPALTQRTSTVANFVDRLETPGTTLFTVRVTNDLPEPNQANNTASATVTTQAALDLEPGDLRISSDPASLGSDVTFTVTLRNRGTVDAPSFTVSYRLREASGAVTEIRTLSAQLDAGKSTEQAVTWRVDRTGPLTLMVEVNPANLLLESDETNNQIALDFVAAAISEPNLTVASADIAFDPSPGLEGAPLALSVLVRNTGGTTAENVLIGFYDGDPDQGGVQIASATVASLAAGTAATASATWPLVTGSADRLIFVVVDPLGELAEFDESDNKAFRELQVASLPDLAISPASLVLEPAFPSPEEPVTLRVTVANLGEQPAEAFVVRAFRGDPAAGGDQVGGDQTLSVAALGSGPVAFALVFPVADERPLVVRVDADEEIVEGSEANNTAQIQVAVQSGDFQVSHRYFSPNGDGVKDATRLSFRLDPSGTAVAVRIVNEKGDVVRRHADPAWAGAAGGAFEWDGRDDLGRVARDELYRLEVVDGELLRGFALAEVDTDRSPLIKAVATDFAHFTNLTCQVPELIGFTVAPDEQHIYFSTVGNSKVPRGIYRMATDGADVEELVPFTDTSALQVSPDGSRIAYQPSWGSVWLADADGGDPREVAAGRLIGFGPSGDTLIVLTEGTVNAIDEVAVAVGASSRRLLTAAGGNSLRHVALSADRRRLAVAEAGFNAARLWLIDLSTAASQVVGDVDGSLFSPPFWSPDGKRFAVLSEPGSRPTRISIFHVSGVRELAFDVPVGPYPRELLDPEIAATLPDLWTPDLAQPVREVAWSESGGDLAFFANFGDGCFGEGTVWRLFRIDVAAGSLDGIAWTELLLPDASGCSPHSGRVQESAQRSPGRPRALTGAVVAAPRRLLPFPSIEGARWWFPDERLVIAGTWGVDVGAGNTLRPLFEEFDQFVPGEFLRSGRAMLFTSDDDVDVILGPCEDRAFSTDLWSFRSLLNLTADLRPRRAADQGGVLLEGTAADLNFLDYRLEWSPAAGAEVWSPIAPPANRMVVDDLLGTWVPHGPGHYKVRLTVTDRAGNSASAVKRVASTDAPSIANVFVKPESFSALGGSTTFNQAEIHYDVLEPVQLEFQIFDEGGERVRTLSGSHFAAAPGQQVVWNGLSDGGRPVPDGTYRITVQNYELFVTVDSTPPAVALDIATLDSRDGGKCQEVTELRHVVFGSVSDPNLADRALEVGEGTSPASWREIGGCSALGQRSDCRALPTLEEVTTQRYRLAADDHTGNRTVVVAPLPPEELMVMGFGNHRVAVSGSAFASLLPVPWFGAGHDFARDPQPRRLYARKARVRMEVHESVRAPLHQLYVQYRETGVPEWRESLVSLFLPPGATPASQSLPLASDHRFDLLWNTTDVPAGRDLVIRLRGVEAHGEDRFSLPFLAVFEAVEFRGRLRASDTQPSQPHAAEILALLEEAQLDLLEDDVLWAVRQLADSATEVSFFLRSDSDPNYAGWRQVPLAATGSDVFVVAPTDLDPAASYTVSIEVRSNRSACVEQPPLPPFQGLPSEDPPTTTLPPRFDLEVTSTFFDAPACGEPFTGLFVRMVPEAEHVATERLTLSLVTPSGDLELFAVDAPRSGRVYRFETPVTVPFLETQVYRAVLTVANGGRVERRVTFQSDGTPPVPAITFPGPGQKVCTEVRDFGMRGQRRVFDVLGSITDNGRFDYLLALERVDETGQTRRYVLDGSEGLGARGYTRTSFSGLLGSYGDDDGEPPFSGPARLRLQVGDDGGHFECREVEFVLDGDLEPVAAAVREALISPNGDGVLDEASIDFFSTEPALLTIDIFAFVATPLGEAVAATPARRLVADLSVHGEGTLFWDGRGDDGAPLPDGRYAVASTFRDACRHTRTATRVTEIDTRPPDLAVSFPTPADSLGLVVEVIGTAGDRNFARWGLDWGKGLDPTTWTAIRSASSAVSNGVLAAWNLAALEGPTTLRLSGLDRAGNTGEVRVALDISARENVIGGFAAVPDLVSPNGDGRLDASAIRFALNAPALVDVTVLREDGTSVRTLATGESLAAGDHVKAWDGKGVNGGALPDGAYVAWLQAAPTAAPQVRDEARVSVVLDSTQPTLTLTRPLDGGFVKGAGDVTGVIGDLYLEGYSISLASNPGAPAWSEMTSGSSDRAGVLIDLGDLDEGSYGLRVVAADRAGNRSELVLAFTVDNTPPAVRLLAPVAASFLSAAHGPVAVRGSVEEEHLAAWRVELGPGEDPATWALLATGATPPASDALAFWDLATVGEGRYTLQAVAEDLAGWVSSARVVVTVDSTPPMAVVTAPAAGGYVRDATLVSGTASDANFEEYRLAVAPVGTTQFSVLRREAQPVNGGLLAEWRGLPPDGAYTLRLEVDDLAGNRAAAEVAITVDRTPPPAPTNLSGRLVDGQDAHLEWDAVNAADLAGYALYREGVPVDPALIAGTQAVDADLPTGTYRFTVVAVDRAGNESAPSNEVRLAVDLQPPTTVILRPADGSRVQSLLDVVGTAFSPEDFAEYRLLVGAGDGSGGFQLLRRSPVPIQGGLLGQWNAIGQAEGAAFILRLEAEDIGGNLGVDEARVVLDDTPPAPPVLNAVLSGTRDVQATWSASSEADLAGYLLFRNGTLANATGPVVGDLTPLLLPPAPAPSYLDGSLRDGTYTYEVVAVDQAGNQSLPSSPKQVTIETGSPRAVIAEPAAGTEFDRPLYVLATTADLDVAQVRLQVKALAASTWTDIAPPDTAPPYEGIWDPAGQALGQYQLRAVATDRGGRTDPAPPAITVRYADVTAPDAAEDLTALVDGGSVTVAWTAAGGGDIAGYHVFRSAGEGSPTRVTVAPVPQTAYVDGGVADGAYLYTVRTTDARGNLAVPSNPAAARVHTPAIAPLDSPTSRDHVDVTGTSPVAGLTAFGTVVSPQGSADLPEVAVDAAGAFTFPAVVLGRGLNTLTMRTRDAAGNRSKPASLQVTSAPPPSAPTWRETGASRVVGPIVELAWNPNPEPDLLGYRIFRDGAALLPQTRLEDFTGILASSVEDFSQPANAVDGDPGSVWYPDQIEDLPREWIGIEWSGGRRISRVEVDWETAFPPESFDVEVWSGGQWRVVARVLEAPEGTSRVSFDPPAFGSKLRVVQSQKIGVAELCVFFEPLVVATTFAEPRPNGIWTYTLSAVNTAGFEGGVSLPLPVAVDADAPAAPIQLTGAAAGSRVDLAWSASTVAGVARYDLFHDGQKLAERAASAPRSYSDEGLRNATYRYVVVAVDGAGVNRESSNQLAVTVDVEPPAAPLHLIVTAVPGGGALDVTWQPVSGAQAYELRRSLVAGGPHQPVVTTLETSFRDVGLTAGATYYYVVVARDALGNPGPPSTEASGVPLAASELPAPVLDYPGQPGSPFVTDLPAVDVRGSSAPGVTVSLLRGGVTAGETRAHNLGGGEVAAAQLQPGGSLQAAPDGQRLVLRDSTRFPLSLYDYGSDQETEILGVSGVARWFADSRRIAFANGGLISAYDVEDGSLQPLVTVDAATVAAPAPDGRRLAVVGERGGVAGLWTVDLDTETWTLLVEGDLDSFATSALQWSPDSVWLATLRAGAAPRLELAHTATAALQVVETAPGPSVPDWTPDSGTLVFTSVASGREQVTRFVLAAAGKQTVTTGPLAHGQPRVSPGGTFLAYFDEEGILYRQDRGGQVDGMAFVPIGGDLALVADWAWTDDHFLALRNSQNRPLRRSISGRFDFEAVVLEPGDNVFTAIARDSAGGVSPESEPMIVTTPDPGKPDLAVAGDDISMLPAVPRPDTPIRLTISVRNLGDAASPTAEYDVLLRGPAGAVLLASRAPLAPLAAGEIRDLVIDRSGLVPGVHQVEVTLDPADAVRETSEANNRAVSSFNVAPAAAPRVAVATDRAAYSSHELVSASVQVSNGGDAFSGALDLAIEDAAGFLVQSLGVAPVVGLAFGETETRMVSWDTAATLAGDYRVRARLLSEAGDLVDEAFGAFALRGEAGLEASVVSDRGRYTIGDGVRLAGTVRYTQGNTALSGLEVRLRILDPAEVVGAEWTQVLGSLLPGGEVVVARDWNSAGQMPGLYQAELFVRSTTELLAAATTGFELAPGAAEAPDLAASKRALLAFDADGDDRVSPGDRLRYEIAVTNAGTAAGEDVVFRDAVPEHTALVAGSLAASQGVVVGSDPVEVRLGAIGAGAAAAVTFEVSVTAPFPSGVAAVVNQGRVDAQGVTGLLTDDPGTLQPADATVTAVFAAPSLFASKVDSLAADRDGDGIPSPGDSIGYTITVSNVGNLPATSVRLTDFIPVFTRLVAGSVISTRGTIETGEEAVSVLLGELGSGESATVSFEVAIDDQLPDSLLDLRNQGLVTSAELPAVLTDDPDLGGPSDATLTAVTAAPRLLAEKTARLAVDADGDGAPSPGDAFEYEIVVRSVGNAPAAGVVVDDPIPGHTTLVAGSAATTQGTITEGDPVRAAIGRLDPGTTARLVFRVAMANPLPAGTTIISNQATVTSDELAPLLSDDPAAGGAADPTSTVVTARPRLEAAKTATLVTDADGDGVVSPGDSLLYHISVASRGNAAATGVGVTDPIPANTAIEPGSVQASQGTVIGEEPVDVALGMLSPGTVATVSFRVTIANPLPLDVVHVVNQATVTSAELAPLLSDDPAVGGDADPTVTPVAIPPAVAIAGASIVEGDSGDSEAEFVVSLSHATPREVRIAYATADGSAIAGEDYEAVAATLLLAPGETQQSIRVTIHGDLEVEDDEIFRVLLLSAEGAVLPAGGISALGTILNDDETTATNLAATKIDELWIDADRDGVASGGDTLRYTVFVSNLGESPVPGIVVRDLVPDHTTVVPGSVHTSQGAVAEEDPVFVGLGDLRPLLGSGAGVVTSHLPSDAAAYAIAQADGGTIGFRKEVKAECDDEHERRLTTQPQPSGSDDCDDGHRWKKGVPTRFTLTYDGRRRVKLTVGGKGSHSGSSGDAPGDEHADFSAFDELFIGARAAKAGSSVVVENLRLDGVQIADRARASSSGAQARDVLRIQDSGLADGFKLEGTITLTWPGKRPDSGLGVLFLAARTEQVPGTATVVFDAKIDRHLPAGVLAIENQASVEGGQVQAVLTDDPATVEQGDPTATPLSGSPDLRVTKSARLLVDRDRDGRVDPGDMLEYWIRVSNEGDAAAHGVMVLDQLPEHLSIGPGSVTTNRGKVLSEDPVLVSVGTLVPTRKHHRTGGQTGRGTAMILVRVRVDAPLPQGVETLSNQAQVSSQEQPDLVSDDPATVRSSDPTVTPVDDRQP